MIIPETKLVFVEKIVFVQEFNQAIVHETLNYFWKYWQQRDRAVIIE